MARPKGHYLLPDRLDEHMAAAGKTLTLIADESGIHRATLSGLYGQHHAASIPVAHQLSQATGVPIACLFPTLSARWAGRAA